MEPCYLFAGLGNPGKQYQGTRHNVGFDVVAQLVERWSTRLCFEKKFMAELASAHAEERRLIFCRPLTFMNLSGQAIQAVAGYYNIDTDRILVSVDDADLELGSLRLRPDGSSGGHRGLQSIEGSLGTRQYARQRLGIGRQMRNERDLSGHVLSRFKPQELEVYRQLLERATEQAECWLRHGPVKAMSRFNGTIRENE